MIDAFGDVVGKPNKRFITFMPIASSFFSSPTESFHDSALLSKHGSMRDSYNERITRVSMPFMTSDEATVLMSYKCAHSIVSLDYVFVIFAFACQFVTEILVCCCVFYDI